MRVRHLAEDSSNPGASSCPRDKPRELPLICSRDMSEERKRQAALQSMDNFDENECPEELKYMDIRKMDKNPILSETSTSDYRAKSTRKWVDDCRLKEEREQAREESPMNDTKIAQHGTPEERIWKCYDRAEHRPADMLKTPLNNQRNSVTNEKY